MTLGNVYDMDLKKNEGLIREVIVQAQGEVRPRLLQRNPLILDLDGLGRVYKASQGDMDKLHFGPGQLPE